MEDFQSKNKSMTHEKKLSSLIHSIEPKELQTLAKDLTYYEIPEVMDSLKDPSSPLNSEKIDALLRGISDISLLEEIGKHINQSQLLEMLHFAGRDREHAWKLFPIFVTIPQMIFNQILLEMPENGKKQLQKFCCSEPLQHHLLLFIHELKKQYDQLQEEYLLIQQEIETLDGEKLLPEELEVFQNRLKEFREKALKIRYKIENALSLAWNASCEDLIEMLSEHRERYERFIYNVIGHPAQHSTSSSGFFRLLENQLANVFGKDSSRELEALKDNEPAFEALARLGLWYMEDYWKLGLLPEIKDPNEISLPLVGNNGDLMTYYQNQVGQNLKSLGLKTVRDFKKHHLVSIELLKRYIQTHQNKMKKKATPL